ncbi:MAG: beta-hexosaminidase [Muribaculaceae bacterium]|nr:beta-hexosaminidase [Muribaculaceae bacterium]
MNLRRVISLLPPLLLLAACSRPSAPGADSAASAPAPPVADITSEARAWADSVTDAMTLEEQVGQLFMPASFTRTDKATMRLMTKYVADDKVGGMVFLKGDTLSMRLIADSLQKISRIPMFLAVDAEWGLGMRLAGATVYPKNWLLTDVDEQWMYTYGHSVASECAAVGLNMVLGPVLDVAPGPGTVMFRRSLGSDPEYVARMGVAYARGVEDAGLIPVAKHFPGHGFTRTDSHDLLPLIRRTAAEMDSIDLLPFRRYIDLGFPAIMAGHIAVPALSGDSVPAVLSPKVISVLLRDRLRFHGLLITDALNMKALDGGMADSRAVATLRAGADMLIAPVDTRRSEAEVIEAVRTGKLPQKTIQDRCRRILFYKYLFLLR